MPPLDKVTITYCDMHSLWFDSLDNLYITSMCQENVGCYNYELSNELIKLRSNCLVSVM